MDRSFTALTQSSGHAVTGLWLWQSTVLLVQSVTCSITCAIRTFGSDTNLHSIAADAMVCYHLHFYLLVSVDSATTATAATAGEYKCCDCQFADDSVHSVSSCGDCDSWLVGWRTFLLRSRMSRNRYVNVAVIRLLSRSDQACAAAY